MSAIGVIPARWASTRLPGKVLVRIGGKPMVQHVWERAKQCRSLSDVVIACDAENVLEACQAFGAKAVMTLSGHPSGSDRIAEVVADMDSEMVVNIQSDEPFIDPLLIDELVSTLRGDQTAVVATPIKPISSAEELHDPNVVKVVTDKSRNALYFSRSPIPFHRDGVPESYSGYYRHLGLYAYRRKFLLEYCRWPKSFLEGEEKLEQLRILEAGERIKCVETDAMMIGVDTPEDVERAVAYLRGVSE